MKSSRLKAHLKAAYAYSELSHARRLKVGAVLVREDRIISLGYNGTLTDSFNNCELELFNDKTGELELVTKSEVCHAELNCIAFAAKNGIATKGASLVVTDSPCYDCSKLLVQAGIKAIYYDREYRDTMPLMLLEEHEITVERIKA